MIGISENDHSELIPGSLLCSLSEVAFYFRELNNVLLKIYILGLE